MDTAILKSKAPLPSFVPPDGDRDEKNRFAFVIPVYNHGQTIADVVRKAMRHQIPVIVVDDGSTDKSFDNIKNIPGIIILRHPYNRGKGAALISGMTAAAKFARWAICLDADGQHDPDDIIHLMEAIPAGKRPIVVGKRVGMQSAPWTSRFGRGFSNFWVWVSSGIRLHDSQSGFRIYPLPEVLDLQVRSGKYQYEIEVLAKAAWRSIPIVEAPVGVSYCPGGRRISHFDPWRDFVRNTQIFSRLIVRRIFTVKLWRVRRKGG